MATLVADKPKTSQKPAEKPASARRLRAEAERLSKKDQEFLDGLVLPKARNIGEWVWRGVLVLRKKIGRVEFETVCDEIRNYLDGKALEPWEARSRAKKLFEAYTDVACSTGCPVCEETWIAILIVQVRGWSGTMFYSRSFQLTDPNRRSKP